MTDFAARWTSQHDGFRSKLDFAASWTSPQDELRRTVDVAETRPSMTRRSTEVGDTRLPSRIQQTVLRRPRCMTSGVQPGPSASGQALAMDLQLLMGLPHLIHQGIEQGIHQGIVQGIEAVANVADTVVEWTSNNVRKTYRKSRADLPLVGESL
jgi:hypothetical protein